MDEVKTGTATHPSEEYVERKRKLMPDSVLLPAYLRKGRSPFEQPRKEKEQNREVQK